MKSTSIFIFFLLIVIAVKLGLAFWNAPEQITNREELHEIWLHSQYNLSQGYEFYGNMSDEDLRTYSALEYIQGRDPSIVNWEDPPLAKYLFGLSHLLFGNILIIQFILSIFAAFLTYLLARSIGLSSLWSFIPSLVLVFDPLFVKSSTSVNLDLPQLVLVLFVLFLLTRRSYDQRVFLLLGVAIGAVMASKVVFTGLLLLMTTLLLMIIKLVPRLPRVLFLIASSSLIVYLLSYAIFFAYHSASDFISLHIKIARLYRGYLPEYPWFEIWRILFLGRWRTWFADPPMQPVIEYWIAWPLSTLLTFSLLLKKEIRRLPLKPAQILLGWSFVYLAFQSIHVVFPRYLLIVIPLLYVLGIGRVSKLKLSG